MVPVPVLVFGGTLIKGLVDAYCAYQAAATTAIIVKGTVVATGMLCGTAGYAIYKDKEMSVEAKAGSNSLNLNVK